MLLVGMTGCLQPPSLSTEYGRTSGTALSSVNGTSALAKLFRKSGKRVSVSRRLGDLVARADVVVWAPDSYDLPRRSVTRYFDAWLADKPGRRLVYIAKDYDGAIHYWNQMTRAHETKVEVQRRLARAIAASDLKHAALPTTGSCDWFRVERVGTRRKQIDNGDWRHLFDNAGQPELAGLFETRTCLLPKNEEVVEEEELQNASDRLVPLLADGKNVLVAEYHRHHWGDAKIVVFSSGAWLFNLPLVELENRLVAERLVDECATARRVVFLETADGGPSISDGKTRHHALEAFTVRPFNSILLHLTVLGMMFCCAVFPIFGRPKPVVESVRSDFRRHVVALGELIARTGDVQYARDRRDYYWTKVRRESGASQTDEEDVAERAGSSTATVAGNPFSPVAAKSDTTFADTAEMLAKATVDKTTDSHQSKNETNEPGTQL